MIKPSSLAACLATIAIAVPAGWHLLEADIQADGPKIRPPQETVTIDDATVSVQVDRGVLPTGGTISAILVATSDRPHPVTVDVTTLEDMGMGPERVSNPPLQVDRRKLVLQALPGGGPPVVASVKLGSHHDRAGVARWFDINVAPHGTRPSGESTVAHAGIATWSGNSFATTIEPPATIPAEGPFTVAVRVKNTTKHVLSYLDARTGGRLLGSNDMDTHLEMETDDYDLTDIDEAKEADDALAPGAEKLFVYRVTPKRPNIRHFTFVTQVTSDSGSAMEVASIDRPEAPAPVEPAPAPDAPKTPSLAVR